ncbi:MAG: Flp pilus assembly complex ATPase component TadA [Desulfobulbaceae bacterium]|nr:Flp pilus assembly complex ATPase component TadA [Desulfobulbaceae bacterium]
MNKVGKLHPKSNGAGEIVLADFLETISDRPQMAINAGFASALLNLTKDYWSPIFPAQSNLLNAWVQTDYPLEYFLVANGGVPRVELLHKIIELKGTYGFPLMNEFVEAGLGRRVSQAAAEKLGLLPLATCHNRLYCLIEQNNRDLAPGRVLHSSGALDIVPIGRVANVSELLGELYMSLDLHDSSNRRLGEYLVQLGILTTGQLDEALRLQADSGERLGVILIRLGRISEAAFYEALAALQSMPFYRRSTDLIKLTDVALAKRLPRAYCERNLLLAMRQEGDVLWVVTDEPKGLEKVAALGTVYHTDKLHLGVAAPSSIRNALNYLYGDQDGSFNLDVAVQTVDLSELHESVEIGSGIPKFLDYLLYEGIRRRSSDIHIECYEKRVDIKLRIDGELHNLADTKFITPANVRSLVAKIKVDSKLDIAEQRRPQDGVIRKHVGGQIVDFRVAICPSLWGENAVLRILNQSVKMPKLDEMGFSAVKLAKFRRLIQNPQGFIIMTGPTGSGKTTTLYAILQELLKFDLKIVTVEDPIEYAVDGIQQSQANVDIGNSFDRYLRSFMRCDPDVILVGEIRDPETAQMATRAALTGHLVLSTLHVNDSISTVRRLVDLGVEPNLVSQTLLGVISQRLTRKSCRHCLHPYKPEAELLAEFFPEGVPGDLHFVRGTGCSSCEHTGYSGRLALVEFWSPVEEERILIDACPDAGTLRKAAIRGGMEMLVADAIDKIAKGLTTMEEVRKVVPFTQIVNYWRAVREAAE